MHDLVQFLASDPNTTIVFLTFGLLLVAAAQCAVYFWQARLMRRALAETQRAAEAAGRSADAATANAHAAEQSVAALMKTERAYVTMLHGPPGVRFPRTQPPQRTAHQSASSDQNFSVKFVVTNSGNTPAHVTDVRVGMWVSPMLDRSAITLNGGQNSAFLAKGAHFTVKRNFSIPASQMTAVQEKKTKLWIVGEVDYIDQFGTRHRAGYTHVYTPLRGPLGLSKQNNLTLVSDPGANYDRIRVQGEGHDWST